MDSIRHGSKMSKKEHMKKYREANKAKCDEYSKKYREANREKLRENAKVYREANKDKIRERSVGLWVKRKYEGIPCMDCESIFPFCVMDFDHRPEEVKKFILSANTSNRATPERLAKVMKEIDKCDLVCANCHRVRTHIDRSSHGRN